MVPFLHALIHSLKLKHLGCRDHLSKHYKMLAITGQSPPCTDGNKCQTLQELPKHLLSLLIVSIAYEAWQCELST